MSKKGLTPFALACNSCGGSMNFDIVNQNYACRFCGNTEPINIRKETIENWTKTSTNNLKANKGDLKKYQCPNCGSVVNTIDDSQTLECFACASTMITADFTLTDEYPVAVIPFKLTLEETKKLVKKELDNSLKNLSNNYKNAIRENLDNLREIYLPFQLFTGPVDASVMRYGKYNSRQYNLKSYMNQKVVIACDNVDNDLIEKIEPFNMDDLKPFEFNYIAGHQAKTQDNSYNQLYHDFKDELIVDMTKSLAKKLGTEHLDVDVSTHDEISMPVLLPVFTLNVNGAKLSINGQTGKIAVKDEKQKVSHKWVLEPLLYTAIISALSYYFSDGEFGIVMGMTVVFGLIMYAIFSDANRRIIYNKMFETKDVYTREGRRLAKAGLKFKPNFEPPVFYEKIDNKVQPVEVQFFPTSLKLFIAFFIIVSICLPEFIVLLTTPIMLLTGTSFFQIFRGISSAMLYTAAWKCLSLPIALVVYFTHVKQGLYDRVYARKYGSNDKFKSISGQFHIFKKLFNGIIELFSASFWMGLGVTFIILVSTTLIYTEGIYGDDIYGGTKDFEDNIVEETEQTADKEIKAINKKVKKQDNKYKPILDEVFTAYKAKNNLGTEYKIETNFIHDYDDDGNTNAIVLIANEETYTHLLYFDLDNKEAMLKDEIIFDDNLDKLINEEKYLPFEKEWISGLEYISVPNLDYSSIVKLNIEVDENFTGFMLYSLDNGKLEAIIDGVPSGEYDTIKLLSKDDTYCGYSRRKCDYETFYYPLDATYMFNEGMVTLDKAELTVPEEKKIVDTPEEVVTKYVELLTLQSMFCNYNENEDKWIPLPVKGLREELKTVTMLDFNPNFLWDNYLVESISLGEEPAVEFNSKIDGNNAYVYSEIKGNYPYSSVCSAGDKLLINYYLEKKDNKWIIVSQETINASWQK